MIQTPALEDPAEVVRLMREVAALTERLEWQNQLVTDRLHEALASIQEYNKTAEDCNCLLRRLERAGFHTSTDTHQPVGFFTPPEQRMLPWECAPEAQFQGVPASSTDFGEAASSSMQPQPQQQQQQQPQQQHRLGAQRPLRQLKAGLTSLVVRNIPRGYTQDKFINEIMPDDTLDFVHLPSDTEKGGTAGYAFVNFTSHAAALEFQRKWHGRFLSKHIKTRAIDVAGSFVEGYEANLNRHLQLLSEDVDDSLMPAVFSHGVRVSTREELQRLHSRGADGARRSRR